MAKATKKEVATPTQEVAKTTLTSVPAAQGPDAAWGSENVSGQDLLVSKLLVMQGLSKLVSDGDANVGQIRDSLEGKLLGGKEKPVDVIAFTSFRTWVIFEKIDGKDEYVKTEPMTPDNENWLGNEIVGGVEIRRDRCLNFYVLRPEEIKEGMAFPYLVSFRRTSSQAGKKLSTFAAKLKAFGKPMAAKVVSLSVQAMENDKGKFFGFDVNITRDSTEAEIAEAKKWYLTLKTAKVTVDDSDLKKNASGDIVPGSPGTPDGTTEY